MVDAVPLKAFPGVNFRLFKQLQYCRADLIELCCKKTIYLGSNPSGPANYF